MTCSAVTFTCVTDDRQTDGHSDDGTSRASMVSYGKSTVVFSTISPIISKTVQDTSIVTMEVIY